MAIQFDELKHTGVFSDDLRFSNDLRKDSYSRSGGAKQPRSQPPHTTTANGFDCEQCACTLYASPCTRMIFCARYSVTLTFQSCRVRWKHQIFKSKPFTQFLFYISNLDTGALIIMMIIIIIIISVFPYDLCTYKLVFILAVLHMKKEEAEVQYLWGTSSN